MSEQQDIATKDFFARVRALGLEKGTIVGIVDRLEAVIKQRDELLAEREHLAAKAGEVMRERVLVLMGAHLINSESVRALPDVTLEDLQK